MAVNKYMHPRNIYKSPPNFKELAFEFPEFKTFVKQDFTGKITLDFKDLKSLRALSCTLLKKDFGLEVEMPLNKLIPTIPLRLNYILWIEDLLSLAGQSENIKGIDIGTGASSIYPLLGAKKNNWSMIATEKDKESVICARSNVERNCLQDLIKVVEVNGDNLLEGVVSETYDFCMCNPPFFSSTQELHPFFKSRKSSRPHPKNAFSASVNEVVSKGGEVEFITKLIRESKNLNKNIKIYSTMIGHKCSLPPLKKLLREVNVASFKETYFCQGNTTRWGLAWTFCENFDLRKVPDSIKQEFKTAKAKQPLVFSLPLANNNDFSVDFVSDRLLKMFNDLQMVVEDVTRNKNVRRYFVTASSNTWSNQRRKRREKTKNNQGACTSCETSCSSEGNEGVEHSEVLETSDDSDEKAAGKRIHNESFDGTFMKKLKISTEGSATATIFFKFMIAIRIGESSVSLELDCTEESDNREYLHQILQYIKNNLNLQI